MLAPLMVATKLLTLKQQLISFFTIELLCESQMSNQMIAMSNFGETLAMWGLEVKLTLSKMCDVLMSDSIKSDLIGMLVPSTM